MESKYKYRGKRLCKVCGENYHPEKFTKCFNCWNVKVDPEAEQAMIDHDMEKAREVYEEMKYE